MMSVSASRSDSVVADCYHNLISFMQYIAYVQDHPVLGRYMEPDPTGLDAGLNPYVYADNNPVMNIDPIIFQVRHGYE